ncbi:hypothetical protein N7450_006570 [Penicillium hetheringtonii]|uniref:Zn(2)-C6 fungal-type domain-containing protein n=1 Tax=Penicillium hetheringtonii TaxID=911720 RepID=A0AAD6GRU8_9EURO|nr:hypothetical protein N7450_006570 [Penicillium hetheringtonii]
MSPPPGASRVRASRSCGNCRAVKRRCDKKTPECGQCIRSHETCPGYRDEWELVFRDQTKHTIKRSKQKRDKSASPREIATHSPPGRNPSPSLDEIGVNYFLQDFVAGGRAPTRGYLNYIPTVYYPDSEHPTLLTSMAAVGLVALATKRPELVGHARAKYSEAIRYVNDAIASPTESIKDSTLMSVISLGVFEHVSNFESWVRHVKGAAALVVARGKSQFTNRVSILMFNQVRADMSAACIQTIQPFPKDIRVLQEEGSKYTDPSDACWLIGILATECATLFAEVAAKNQGTPCSTSWSEFLEESIRLQDRFQEVFDLLAIQEPYTTIQEPDDSPSFISYRGRYDLYRSSWSIRLWNNSRMVDIIVCEIVGICGTNYSATREEILASVPHGLGLVYIPGQYNPADEPPQLCVSGGYMLTWNLYTVGKSPVINNDDRKWVIDRLKGISDSAGIAMAYQLAEDLEKIGRTAM